MFQENGNLSQPLYPLDSSAPAFYHHQPKQNVQLHDANFSRGPLNQCSMDPLDAHNPGIQLSSIDGFGESLTQVIYFSKVLKNLVRNAVEYSHQTYTKRYEEVNFLHNLIFVSTSYFQFPAFSGHDLQSIIQMGFDKDPVKETAFHSDSFHGKDKKRIRLNIVLKLVTYNYLFYAVPNQTSHMKVEL